MDYWNLSNIFVVSQSNDVLIEANFWLETYRTGHTSINSLKNFC